MSQTRAAALVQQCRLLEHMRDTKLPATQGYRNLGDFAREVLNVTPRTARRRLTVAKALAADHRVEQALLSGTLSPCQVEILAPVLHRQEFEFWLRTASTRSVKELRDFVQNLSPPDHRPPKGIRLHIRAPVSAAAAFDHALHTARQVLGWDAPRTECFEAILAEAESSLTRPQAGRGPEREVAPIVVPEHKVEPKPEVAPTAAPEHKVEPTVAPKPARKYGAPEAAPDAPPGAPPGASPGAPLGEPPVDAALQPLHKFLHVLNGELDDLEDLLQANHADPVLRFLLLEQTLRPLTLLQGNLLLATRACLSPGDFSQSTWHAVAESTLRVSARHFRDLIRDAKFLYRHEAESAFVEGGVTLSHLRLIARLQVHDAELDAWIARAKRVTYRQFCREVDLAEKTAHLQRGFAPGPLGFDPVAEPPDVAAEPPAPAAKRRRDPATDPRLLEALEADVHARLLREFPAGVGRQTLAEFGATTTINLLVSRDVFEQWRRLRAAVQATMREPVPSWVCLIQVMRVALHEWEREEEHATKQLKTTAHKVVRRDGYHCTAPGCSQRRRLEAHHIVFRSRGGIDAPQNLTTLCAFHHRYAVHGGIASLTGRARHELHWTFPAQRFHGQRKESNHSNELAIIPPCPSSVAPKSC